jgi:methylenetetrahydrofolate dehydrogenase (NADP+)/methenyltetrahydrofolate cyclohydrolase
LGVSKLLHYYSIPVQGKHVVIVGRSVIVGKPLAMLLSQHGPHGNATVTIAHRGTQDLPKVCQSADILIAAAGSPRLITNNMIKNDAVIVDVGISRLEEQGKSFLVGDVDFDNVISKVAAISPVPGGVGPMTVASLLANTIKSFQQRRSL